MFEKNTPRDFVLHLGAFLILYCGAIALITLLFSVINYAFPDPLYGGYSDPYSGPLRFAIASLIVMAPLAVYLFYIIQNAARRDPERKTLGVRKWLTYITLLITGATIVGDVIILLNNFLGGELPETFLLKVLVIFGVMGAGFGYFFLDIKGYWLANAAESRYVGLGVLLFVLLSIVGGMVLLGSPMKQRDLRVDYQQINDLATIQSQVLSYRFSAQTLPPDAESIANPAQGFIFPEAPEDRSPYIYRQTGVDSFELCATFALPSVAEPYSRAVEPAFTSDATWEHDAGLVCFERTINPAYFEAPEQLPIEIPIKR